MLSPLTKEELVQYIALQDRVYLYAESIAEIYSGLSQGENVEAVRIENETVSVNTTYSFEPLETNTHYFPAAFLTKSLDEIRGFKEEEKKIVSDQKEKKEYEEYMRLKAKFEK